jgi:hypothetical protein
VTHTFKLHLYQVHFDFMEAPAWHIADSKGLGKDDPEWLYIGPRDVTVEVPGFQDMREHQIAALKEQERKLRADFQNRITEIQTRINNLLAVEMA